MASQTAVIIPTHNRSDLLAITLHNVMAVASADITVFVVDDGSSDDTPSVIAEALRADTRFDSHRFEVAQGACAARNFGVERTESDYVCFLDADDLIHPDKFSLQAHILETNQDLDAAICQMAHFVEDPTKPTVLWNTFQGAPLTERFLGHDPVWGIHAPLWRRKCLTEIGGLDESLPMAQDFDLHGRLLLAGAKVYLHADLLAYCRRHEGPSISSSRRIARLATLAKVFRNFLNIRELGPTEDHALIGSWLWLATLAAIEGDRQVMHTALQEVAMNGGTLVGFPYFRLLCGLTCRTRRHRFFSLARGMARKMGHDPVSRESWYYSHPVQTEPDLTFFPLPESCWNLGR